MAVGTPISFAVFWCLWCPGYSIGGVGGWEVDSRPAKLSPTRHVRCAMAAASDVLTPLHDS